MPDVHIILPIAFAFLWHIFALFWHMLLLTPAIILKIWEYKKLLKNRVQNFCSTHKYESELNPYEYKQNLIMHTWKYRNVFVSLFIFVYKYMQVKCSLSTWFLARQNDDRWFIQVHWVWGMSRVKNDEQSVATHIGFLTFLWHRGIHIMYCINFIVSHLLLTGRKH